MLQLSKEGSLAALESTHHSTNCDKRNVTVKMFGQQYNMITDTDSCESAHFSSLLKRLQKSEKLGVGSDTVEIDAILSSYGITKGERYKLTIPYAKQNLNWIVFFDSECPELGPDFIFNDDAFLAHMDIDTFSTNVPSLANWDPNDEDALLKVLEELIFCYKQYQIRLLEQQDLLHLEYTMLMQSGEVKLKDVEMILLPLASKPTEARFLVNLEIDVSEVPHRTHQSVTEMAMLVVTFRGPDWNYITPQLYLTKSLEVILSGSNMLDLPYFSGNTSLAVYVSELKTTITGKIDLLVQSLERRRTFFTAMMARLYGSQIEYDAISFTYLVQLLSKDNFQFLLEIHLSPGFPRDPPIVILRSVYHFTQDGVLYTEVLKNCPYNQRAKPKTMAEMIVEHAYNSVDDFKNNSIRSCSRTN